MDSNSQYGSHQSTTPFCLGHPPHAVRSEDVICSICGTLVAGTILGVYQVQKYLGQGRGGQAYLATHQRSHQSVVIKLFPPDHASMDLWEAARRDVRVVTALRHPAILPVFSCTTWQAGTKSGMTNPPYELTSSSPGHNTYLLTLCQYIPGSLSLLIDYYKKHETRRALYERGMTALTHIMNLVQQAGSALSAAHARGIAHGAIVPGNLLFSSQEHLWLADFGLARLHAPSSPYLPPEFYSIANTDTHSYWRAVNPASDQYMLAVLCQYLFSQILQPADYEHLLPVLKRASNHNPTRRYASIDLFVHDLAMLTARPPKFSQGTAPELVASKSTTGHNFKGLNDPAASLTPITQDAMAPLTPLPSSGSHSPIDEWERRGDKLFTMRDYEGALKAYHRALELDQRRPTLWIALGDTYIALERYKEALLAYEQAMEINPNDPLTWSNRGTALDALGRHKEAMDCYDRAEQLR